ncbi:hypothetical protein ACWGTI_10460 [Mesorhizobium sp. ArgA1]
MIAAATDGTLGAFTLGGVNVDDDQAFSGLATFESAVGHVTNLAADAARALSAVSTATVEAFVARTYS